MSKPSVESFIASPLFNPSSEPSLLSARDSAVALPSAFQGVDLLITSAPPPSLKLLSPSAGGLNFPLSEPAAPLVEAVKKSRPRYLFWADGEGFWEREPLGWEAEGKQERWTRAVKLGALGAEEPQGGKKARVSSIHLSKALDDVVVSIADKQWFYAFTLPAQTSTSPLPTRPANATPNPFDFAVSQAASTGRKRAAGPDTTNGDDEEGGKRPRTDADASVVAPDAPSDVPPEGYVCKICATPGVSVPHLLSSPSERGLQLTPALHHCMPPESSPGCSKATT